MPFDIVRERDRLTDSDEILIEDVEEQLLGSHLPLGTRVSLVNTLAIDGVTALLMGSRGYVMTCYDDDTLDVRFDLHDTDVRVHRNNIFNVGTR